MDVSFSTERPAGATHDLRHHYANVLLAAGESVVAVAVAETASGEAATALGRPE